MNGVSAQPFTLEALRLKTAPPPGKTPPSGAQESFEASPAERLSVSRELSEEKKAGEPLALDALLANFAAPRPGAALDPQADQKVQGIGSIDTRTRLNQVQTRRGELQIPSEPGGKKAPPTLQTAAEQQAGAEVRTPARATPRPVDQAGGSTGGNSGSKTGQRQLPEQPPALARRAETVWETASATPSKPGPEAVSGSDNWLPSPDSQPPAQKKNRVNPMDFSLSYDQQQKLRTRQPVPA